MKGALSCESGENKDMSYKLSFTSHVEMTSPLLSTHQMQHTSEDTEGGARIGNDGKIHRGKTTWLSLITLKMHIPHRPAIPVLSGYPRESFV